MTTITNTWGIVSLDCKPDVNGFLNYVVTSHWELTASDGKGHNGYIFGNVSFTIDPSKSDYVPYADLTEDLVIQWTQEALGAENVSAFESITIQQVNNQINPNIVSPPLPW